MDCAAPNSSRLNLQAFARRVLFTVSVPSPAADVHPRLLLYLLTSFLLYSFSFITRNRVRAESEQTGCNKHAGPITKEARGETIKP
eukprot:6937650-Pyramimonas_sp.AAC.1